MMWGGFQSALGSHRCGASRLPMWMRIHLVLALFLCSLAARAADEPLRIPDVQVVDQGGRSHSFYSGLVKDRVVAVNFVFTSCTTICPVMGATFAQVQKL